MEVQAGQDKVGSPRVHCTGEVGDIVREEVIVQAIRDPSVLKDVVAVERDAGG